MIPGINPKKMKQMMKQLGMKMNTLEDVESIVIKTAKGNYVFDNAEVVETTMQGTTTYQITGESRFEGAEIEISEEDVTLVSQQASVSPDQAKEALKKSKGDIAEAIISLTSP